MIESAAGGPDLVDHWRPHLCSEEREGRHHRCRPPRVMLLCVVAPVTRGGWRMHLLLPVHVPPPPHAPPPPYACMEGWTRGRDHWERDRRVRRERGMNERRTKREGRMRECSFCSTARVVSHEWPPAPLSHYLRGVAHGSSQCAAHLCFLTAIDTRAPLPLPLPFLCTRASRSECGAK
jgi:hypothetical protein